MRDSGRVVFIDAEKEAYLDYLKKVFPLVPELIGTVVSIAVKEKK